MATCLTLCSLLHGSSCAVDCWRPCLFFLPKVGAASVQGQMTWSPPGSPASPHFPQAGRDTDPAHPQWCPDADTLTHLPIPPVCLQPWDLTWRLVAPEESLRGAVGLGRQLCCLGWGGEPTESLRPGSCAHRGQLQKGEGAARLPTAFSLCSPPHPC